MLSLCCGRRSMVFARNRFLGCRGTSTQTTTAPVIADAVDGCVVDNGLVVHIGDVHIADIGHRPVVGENSIVPASAFEPDAGVAETLVDATVEADLRPPVAFIPNESATAPAPEARSPEHTGNGRLHPSAGNPVVAVGAVGPIAGSSKDIRPREPVVACKQAVRAAQWRSIRRSARK
jgi:hypothetical protein